MDRDRPGAGRNASGVARQATVAPEPAEGAGRDLDGLFLVLVVFLPALLYLPALGFYSDDWGLLAAMGEHPNGSLWQYIGWMLPAADLRPGHAVYAALAYFAFGLGPLGYHVVNHLVILAGLVTLASVLRRLGVTRSLAPGSSSRFVMRARWNGTSNVTTVHATTVVRSGGPATA